MKVPIRLAGRTRSVAIGLVMALVFGTAGIAIGDVINGVEVITPKHATDVTNIDILRMELKNYYGTPGAATGPGPTAGWTLPLNLESNYAKEARSVAADGRHFLHRQADGSGKQAIILDVDDTTLTTWNYELYSNWDFFPPPTRSSSPISCSRPRPAWCGWRRAQHLGYAVFFLTGRGEAQEGPTLGNLTHDGIGVDAGYPMPTQATTGVDGLFTKPAIGSYPAYLNKPEFCADAIAASLSCPTIRYKSGTRA